MNQRERDDLMRFLEPLLRARAGEKDATAEAIILEQCARQPDALYLLVQRAMALESALESALQAAQSRNAASAGSTDAEGHARAGASPMPLVRQAAGERSGSWSRGLLAQASTIGVIGAGVGLGVAAGVVAGGLLLDALGDGIGDVD